MVSGFSYSGGPPRCFFFWQQFQKCYAQTDNPVECRLKCREYFACLHPTMNQSAKPPKEEKDAHEHVK